MTAVARPYGVGRRRARWATAGRCEKKENLEWSSAAMAEPVSGPVLAAIGHPLRLALLVALEAREQTPAELAAATGAGEPEVERALAVLSDAGLVRGGGRAGRLRTTGRGWAEVERRLGALDRASRGS
jgi:DNA-binding transcriptional ArsR family regulator